MAERTPHCTVEGDGWTMQVDVLELWAGSKEPTADDPDPQPIRSLYDFTVTFLDDGQTINLTREQANQMGAVESVEHLEAWVHTLRTS